MFAENVPYLPTSATQNNWNLRTKEEKFQTVPRLVKNCMPPGYKHKLRDFGRVLAG